MDFFATWLLVGLISAIIAARKGHSGCGWFGLGILLGPFGLIMALLAPKNPDNVRKIARAGHKWKKCPCCAEKIRAEARKCRYCGEAFGSGEGEKIASASCASTGMEKMLEEIRYRLLDTNLGAFIVYAIIAAIIIYYIFSSGGK